MNTSIPSFNSLRHAINWMKTQGIIVDEKNKRITAKGLSLPTTLTNDAIFLLNANGWSMSQMNFSCCVWNH